MCNLVDRRFLSDRLPHPYASEDADRRLSTVRDHEVKDGVLYDKCIYVKYRD